MEKAPDPLLVAVSHDNIDPKLLPHLQQTPRVVAPSSPFYSLFLKAEGHLVSFRLPAVEKKVPLNLLLPTNVPPGYQLPAASK